MRNKSKETPTGLIDSYQVDVRFSEVDSMQIVWHGNYVKYFEDGRESFGKKYGIDYMNMYAQGYAIPIVHLSCDYKYPLRYGDQMIVETQLMNTEAAKIIYQFRILKADTKELVAEGKSIQVFLNKNHELSITTPDFFVAWKKKMELSK